MFTNLNEIGLRCKSRRSSRISRAKAADKPGVPSRDPRIIDAAFADLETTILRRDDPQARTDDDKASPSYQRVVRHLSAQLDLLDDQRGRLAKLLNDLQTSGGG
jgi:hypothetical protein